MKHFLRRPKALLFLFVSCISLFQLQEKVCAQTPDTLENKIKNSLSSYYKSYPEEKIYIHTNQNVYISGQTLWYKLYATAYGKPSQISKIVYVQLTDDRGNIVIQNKLPLTGGKANGNIDLLNTLPSGWYQLNGFTAWMLNFDKASGYHQKIYIQNPSDTARGDDAAVKPAAKYHFGIFPEGGDLVDGSLCNVAFKATGEDGKPVKVYGELKDDANTEITKLVTINDGMGLFQLEPSPGKKYTAVIHFPDNTIQTAALPVVKKTGVSMQVLQHSTELEVHIAFSGRPEQYTNSVLTTFQNNGHITTYPLQLGRGVNVFSVKKDEFLTGTLRLTVFDAGGLPQAERLVFINSNNQLKMNLLADTVSHLPNGKSVITLQVKDGTNRPAQGNFSVSVIDAGAFNNDDWTQHINTSLLLTSELRSDIYHPDQYFESGNDSLRQQLDLVMLTNGWRHFKWEKVFNKTPVKPAYPVERPLFIAGKISGDNAAALKVKLIIVNADSSRYIGYIVPDTAGRFIINNYNHQGISKIYYEAVDAKNHRQPVTISFMQNIMDTLKFPAEPMLNIGKTPSVNIALLPNGINENMGQLSGITLKNVNVNSKKESPTDKLIKNHVNNLTADNAYTLDLVNNNHPEIGIINYIQGKFPGLQIYDGATTRFVYHGMNTFTAPSDSNGGTSGAFLPYFYLNESRTDLSEVQQIPLFEVALIRFIPPPVWFAPFNGGNVGAITIYTKNHKDEPKNFKSRETFEHYDFNAYSITREFQTPDYSKGKQGFVPDNRITLYWNHDIDTGSDGKAKLRFYNSDKGKKYRVIIQGMDADGRCGYLNEVF